MSLPLLLLLLAGCGIQNGISGDTKPGNSEDSTPSGAETAGDGETGSSDPCNGVDDDGDGAVDEGWPDADGDGSADCSDPCPTTAAAPAGAATSAPACAGPSGPPVEDPWNMVPLWTVGPPRGSRLVVGGYGPAVVGRLFDRDGDGALDDIPAVVVSTFDGCPTDCQLWALDGATGALSWAWGPTAYLNSAPVIADVDADGWPDVLTVGSDGRLVALDSEGRMIWNARADPEIPYGFAGNVSVGDLDGDGAPEVVFDRFILDGRTGGLRAELPIRPDHFFNFPSIADLDLDGQSEIVMNDSVWDSDGELLFQVEPQFDFSLWQEGVVHAIVQADDDDEAEVVFVDQNLSLYNADGSLLWTEPLTDHSFAGPPCSADFDGDGRMELALAVESQLRVYELDGSLTWVTEIAESGDGGDPLGGDSCTAFDFDGDGTAEIVLQDETAACIFDGRSGARLACDDRLLSNTLWEYPTVADVDGDGHADLVETYYQVDTGDPTVVTVWHHAGSGWPAAPTSWPMFDYSSANVSSSGEIAAAPQPAWRDLGVFRAVPGSGAPSRADPAVVVTSVCSGDCASQPIEVAVQAQNLGYRDLPAGSRLVLSTVDVTGARHEIETRELPALPYGRSTEGVVFIIEPSRIDVGGLGVAIQPGEDPEDCDPANDEVVVPLDCPR